MGKSITGQGPKEEAVRKLVEIDDNEGLESLLGEQVTLLCSNYFYTGKLVGVNDTCVKLKNPAIVYETGPWTDSGWADLQHLPCDHLYVQCTAIESFGVLK